MSAPVDVLAVLDDRIEQARSRAGCRSDKPEPIGVTEFRQARAAVAELIDAATAMAGVQVNRQTPRNDAGSAKKARLRAAIARVQGGSA